MPSSSFFPPIGSRSAFARGRAISAVLALFLAGSAAGLAEPTEGRLTRIIDGDTLSIQVGNAPATFRLWGIDAPEREQAFGEQTAKAVEMLVLRKRVKVEPKSDDRYGRKLAEVYLPDGRSLGSLLVQAGYAWWYRQYAPGAKELERFETEAKAKKRGLWRATKPSAPWEFRKTKAALDARPTPVRTPESRGRHSTRTAPRAQRQPVAAQVYRTNAGKKYHRDGCRYLRKSKISCDEKL